MQLGVRLVQQISYRYYFRHSVWAECLTFAHYWNFIYSISLPLIQSLIILHRVDSELHALSTP